MSIYVMTVDPGSEGTGWALWKAHLAENMSLILVDSGVISFPGERDWLRKCAKIASHLKNLVKTHGVSRVYCEEPRFLESRKGHVAARSDSLVKLAHIVGMFHGVVMHHGMFFLVPLEWKGQLDKKKVQERIKKVLGLEFKSHDADAVGIGLYLSGQAFQS